MTVGSALPEKCRITLKIVTTNDYIACNDKFQERKGWLNQKWDTLDYMLLPVIYYWTVPVKVKESQKQIC